VAVSAAALTVYDMCKALDKGMEISDIYWREARGKSGDYLRASGVSRSGGARKVVTRKSGLVAKGSTDSSK